MNNGEQFTIMVEDTAVGLGQDFFERPQHQREWCPEFVTYVTEERRLRPVKFREGFRSLSFCLVGFGVGNRRSEVSRHELEERTVRRIQHATGAHTGDEQACETVVTSGRDRKNDHL